MSTHGVRSDAGEHGPLTARRVGLFELQERIGVGGMGEVYRARDTRLGRDVAVKVLPAVFQQDPGRLARFEREAQTLASLNHPHIGTVYGLEESGDIRALVMEFVDGEDLSEHIGATGMPVTEALRIARQIAAALEAAHERAVVHRDLKPANIRVRPDGAVKVLDFGLAKALAPATHQLSTLTGAPAEAAVALGTPAYMSPEQARGESVNQQTDVWAFGVVLYEMLTGVPSFARPTTAETLASVLRGEPDYGLLPGDTPPGIRRLLRRCLEKDRTRRLRHIGDAALEIDDALASPPGETIETSPVPSGRASSRLWIWLAGLLALTTTIAGVLVVQTMDRADPQHVRHQLRFPVTPPPETSFRTSSIFGAGAPVGGSISPNGGALAFTAADTRGVIRLYVLRLDRGALDAKALTGTEGAALPFWSPDSRSIGFFTPGMLKTVGVDGGTPLRIAGVERARGATWNRDGVILFSGGLRSGLSRVGDVGGEVTPATTLGREAVSHSFPSFLPDGRQFLYYAEGLQPDATGVFVGDLRGGPARRLIDADSAAVYAARSGHILFVRQSTLWAHPFDVSALQLTGTPTPLASPVPAELTSPSFSISENGVLTYRGGAAGQIQHVYYDRDGNVTDTVGRPGTYRGIDLSGDGRHVVVHRHDGSRGAIWTIGADGRSDRVTDPTIDSWSPVFSPDAGHVAYGSLRQGRWGLYQRRSDGGGPELLLWEAEHPMSPAAWSPDGASLVYWAFTDNGQADIWLLPLRGVTAAPTLLAGSSAYEGHAQVSPDGRWMAYMSTRSGRPQVYVTSFPADDGSPPVAIGYGVMPRFSRDSGELFYATAYESGTLMAVRVDTRGPTFRASAAKPLFNFDVVTPPHSTSVFAYHTYAVSPDGERFLMPQPASATKGGDASPSIIVDPNWATRQAQ